ncbi:sorbosone dehydrogenase family protein [Azoarcus sp. L1K30]|nr:sorbosone dehydrogenase family protein [Azoarcus sp. L1K30]
MSPESTQGHTPRSGFGPDPRLPTADTSLIPTVNIARAVGWADGDQPRAAKGKRVTRFADGLRHPRWLYVLPNGDVLVAESNAPHYPGGASGIKAWIVRQVKSIAGAGDASADRITLLRDVDGDGKLDERHVFLDRLQSPFGMTLVGNTLYVANADAVVKFPYQTGQTRITAAPVKVADLPGGPINHHWTKNVIASADGRRLYVAIGSNSNIAENGFDAERGRAAIWEVDADSGAHRIFASGLRNPVGLTWVGDTLWTSVNERDGLGDDLVPDYMTSVQRGGFYGWPYSYFGQHTDNRVEQREPERVATAIKPDYALGAHTSSLGLAYTDGKDALAIFGAGMVVGQHGSWNRSVHSGYEVIFIPFANGKPAGLPRTILSGFLSAEGTAYGRPVGVAFDRQGALLVADDVGNTVWRVSAVDAGTR